MRTNNNNMMIAYKDSTKIPSSILTFCAMSKLGVFSFAISTDIFAISDNADMDMIAEA